MARPVGFVGRERELSRLEGALSGDARLVLVVGDAGIGKTRFAVEGMRRAAAGGMACVRGGCLPLAGELPLLPVADVLGELSRLADGQLLAGALDRVPRYVQAEVARLLPQLETASPNPGSRAGGWQQGRLFSALAELLGAAAGESGLVVVIEDVHWADSATLDCLTYLTRPGGSGALTVVVTCRNDEMPLDTRVTGWLAHARAADGVEEMRLGPLSQAEVAQQIAGLVGEELPEGFAEDLYTRAEGNPFFTEQLVAAALVGSAGEALSPPRGLPERLAHLLLARVSHVSSDARMVLAALAVAGRALSEDILADITGLSIDAVRSAIHELGAARLLAANVADGRYRPRHALLSEAVARELLPGERVTWHERTAEALQRTGSGTVAAETASHWAAAGRAGEELPARVAAAEAAERVCGYAEAGAHWQRAIDLCQTGPAGADATQPAGISVPQLYVRAMDALALSGDGLHAGALAEEACRLFAAHPDHATVAVILQRAAYYRGIEVPVAGLPLIEEALRLFGQGPPTAEYAEALTDYASLFLLYAQGRHEASRAAFNRAREIAEAAGATALLPRLLARQGVVALRCGEVTEGLTLLQQGREVAEASGDSAGMVWVAIAEASAMLGMARFQVASEMALRDLRVAYQAGLGAWFQVKILACNAAEALIALGHTAQAGALIDPMTSGEPNRDNWILHEYRAEIDLLRGDTAAATQRRELLKAYTSQLGSIEFTRGTGEQTAELALWAGRPGDALQEVRRVLALHTSADVTIFCGRLLATGMRACADLAEQARARQDNPAAMATLASADSLVSWVDRQDGAPFAGHPSEACIPADRASWEAELARLAGSSDPAAWAAAAKAWDNLGRPHNAGYAWWRQAQAQLDAGQPATLAAVALRTAAAAAEGHTPLQAQIRLLAERARIPLREPASRAGPKQAGQAALYGLTSRELTVLRLLAAGRTNAQIGAELYISPKTASVHVTSIFRKLGVSGRVQAAALAERAGLLGAPPP
jgi:DNA-binding CsgD family transcriptional regulator/tetratricopeptide (TPR) repeat protein